MRVLTFIVAIFLFSSPAIAIELNLNNKVLNLWSSTVDQADGTVEVFQINSKPIKVDKKSEDLDAIILNFIEPISGQLNLKFKDKDKVLIKGMQYSPNSEEDFFRIHFEDVDEVIFNNCSINLGPVRKANENDLIQQQPFNIYFIEDNPGKHLEPKDARTALEVVDGKKVHLSGSQIASNLDIEADDVIISESTVGRENSFLLIKAYDNFHSTNSTYNGSLITSEGDWSRNNISLENSKVENFGLLSAVLNNTTVVNYNLNSMFGLELKDSTIENLYLQTYTINNNSLIDFNGLNNIYFYNDSLNINNTSIAARNASSAVATMELYSEIFKTYGEQIAKDYENDDIDKLIDLMTKSVEVGKFNEALIYKEKALEKVTIIDDPKIQSNYFFIINLLHLSSLDAHFLDYLQSIADGQIGVRFENLFDYYSESSERTNAYNNFMRNIFVDDVSLFNKDILKFSRSTFVIDDQKLFYSMCSSPVIDPNKFLDIADRQYSVATTSYDKTLKAIMNWFSVYKNNSDADLALVVELNDYIDRLIKTRYDFYQNARATYYDIPFLIMLVHYDALISTQLDLEEQGYSNEDDSKKKIKDVLNQIGKLTKLVKIYTYDETHYIWEEVQRRAKEDVFSKDEYAEVVHFSKLSPSSDIPKL